MEMPLRILQVSTCDVGGGAEGSAWSLFKGYQERGLASWLAVGSKSTDHEQVFVLPNDQNRVLWTRLCRRLQAHGADSRLSPIARLIGKLAWLGEPKRLAGRYIGFEDFHYPGTSRLLDLPPSRPTVVHCHNLHGGYFDLRVLPRLSRQVPLILNLRDAWLLSGHCSHSLGCDRWKNGCGACPDLTIHPAIRRDSTAHNWRLKRNIYERSRLYVTAISNWLMNQVHASSLKAVKYRVIPNAVDPCAFSPGSREAARRELRLPLESSIVLLIAHNTFKDWTLMEATLHLMRRRTDRNLLFVCLGKDEKAHPLGEGQIWFRGVEPDRNRMCLYYRASDVYLHAAKAEAFGKTIVEAMACGTPVVANSIGGIPEIIEDGTNGFLTKPADDATQMGQAVQNLVDHDQLRGQMSQAAAKHARERYALPGQIDAFLDWYAEVRTDWERWRSDEGLTTSR